MMIDKNINSIYFQLLLQLSDSSESLRFLNRTLKEDASEWKKLKAEMGVAIKPILGYNK